MDHWSKEYDIFRKARYKHYYKVHMKHYIQVNSYKHGNVTEL